MESWTTVVLRTFGTVDVEATIDMNSERIALTGKGMSTVMGGVIGQDVGAKIGQIVACSLQPAQPACVGLDGGFLSAEGAASAVAKAAASAVAERLIAPEEPEEPPSAAEDP